MQWAGREGYVSAPASCRRRRIEAPAKTYSVKGLARLREHPASTRKRAMPPEFGAQDTKKVQKVSSGTPTENSISSTGNPSAPFMVMVPQLLTLNRHEGLLET